MSENNEPIDATRGTNNHRLFAIENDGGRTVGRKWEPQPYDCKELIAFLNANPERDSALIRAYIKTQMEPVSCKKP